MDTTAVVADSIEECTFTAESADGSGGGTVVTLATTSSPLLVAIILSGFPAVLGSELAGAVDLLLMMNEYIC